MVQQKRQRILNPSLRTLSALRSASPEAAPHSLGNAPADETDRATDNLSENHHHQITESLHQTLHLGSDGIAGFNQKGDLLLPPLQLFQFLIPRFRQQQGLDLARAQSVQQPAPLAPAARPLHLHRPRLSAQP